MFNKSSWLVVIFCMLESCLIFICDVFFVIDLLRIIIWIYGIEKIYIF